MRITNDTQLGKERDAGAIHDVSVIVKGYKCEKFSPNEYPGFLNASIAGQVESVMTGEGCHMIFLDPKITEGCEIDGAVATAGSIKFGDANVTVFNLKSGDYNLESGQALYEAFRGVCNEFPSAQIMVLGIELKPTGKGVKASLRVEKDVSGQDVARVHIWDGEGYLTIDGENFITVKKGEQIVVSPDGGRLNLIEAHGTSGPAAITSPIDFDQQGYTAHRGADGCSVGPSQSAAGPMATVELTATMILAILGMRGKRLLKKG